MTAVKPQTNLPLETVDAFLQKRGWSWEALMNGAYDMTLEQVELVIVATDPVIFARCFLKNPQSIENSDIVQGDPLILFPYQEESIRYPGDIITQDGSEVGKTLEIVVLLCHAMMTHNAATILVGAPEYVHILEIVDALEDQRSMSPAVHQSIFVKRKAPHYRFDSTIGAKAHLIPAGHDGTAFRGKHVTKEAIFDEAAKVRNPKILSEFFRARMPGCRTRVYSVPDGSRITEYYRLKDEARKAGDGVSINDFRFFHRPKTIQPDPFWTKEREREMIKKYGGRHTSGYVHNVLGLDGEPENPIFPYAQWMKLISDIPEYRIIKLEASETDDTLRIEVFRLELVHDKAEGDKSSGAPSVRTVEVVDEEYLLSTFRTWAQVPETVTPEFLSLLKRFIPPPPQGLFFGGCDPGKINDPAEVSIRQKLGDVSRRVLRVHMRGVPYDVQADVLESLSKIFKLKSMGLDIGGAGTVLLDNINRNNPDLADVVSGHHFNEAVAAVDKDGEELENPAKPDEPIKKSFREAFVNVLVQRVQNRELQEPYDIEVINSFTSYTAKQGSRGLIFSKENDHIVDSDVQAEGAFLSELGCDSFIVGGAHAR